MEEKKREDECMILDKEELEDIVGGQKGSGGSAFADVPRATENAYDQDTRDRA